MKKIVKNKKLLIGIGLGLFLIGCVIAWAVSQSRLESNKAVLIKNSTEMSTQVSESMQSSEYMVSSVSETTQSQVNVSINETSNVTTQESDVPQEKQATRQQAQTPQHTQQKVNTPQTTPQKQEQPKQAGKANTNTATPKQDNVKKETPKTNPANEPLKIGHGVLELWKPGSQWDKWFYTKNEAVAYYYKLADDDNFLGYGVSYGSYPSNKGVIWLVKVKK